MQRIASICFSVRFKVVYAVNKFIKRQIRLSILDYGNMHKILLLLMVERKKERKKKKLKLQNDGRLITVTVRPLGTATQRAIHGHVNIPAAGGTQGCRL
jgi:hypothetical protein